LALTLVACARALPGVGADAPTEREGTNDGADFEISVPANWNGGLVMFAHGYQGEGPAQGTVMSSPMHSHLAHNRYASAVTGYRAMGYRPDWFVADVLALRQRFIREVGSPRWTIIHGQSMGGHVAVAALELHPVTLPVPSASPPAGSIWNFFFPGVRRQNMLSSRPPYMPITAPMRWSCGRVTGIGAQATVSTVSSGDLCKTWTPGLFGAPSWRVTAAGSETARAIGQRSAQLGNELVFVEHGAPKSLRSLYLRLNLVHSPRKRPSRTYWPRGPRVKGPLERGHRLVIKSPTTRRLSAYCR
jgi:pimeloyl-ACP methyl ester carboxylesterase